MKQTRFIPVLFIILIVAFAGCKKGPDKLIEKTWKVTNIVSKGTYDDSTFQAIKTDLMKVEMTFGDNKYTMTSDGNVLESGTYSFADGKMVVTTEGGLKMDALVTKDNLTLDTPDFMTTLAPSVK